MDSVEIIENNCEGLNWLLFLGGIQISRQSLYLMEHINNRESYLCLT